MTVPGWLDVLDIAVVAGFGWLAIGYLRRTRGRAALVGLGVLVAIYFVARALDLRLTATLFQGFFAVVVLVLVVVFQEDLRRAFERLGSWRPGSSKAPADTETLDTLVRAVARLASTRTGALIVLPGHEPFDRHVEGGIPLGGRISEPLLLSLFDASSPGHDGAVVVRGSTIDRFALHLPLSANHAALGPGGTRHAAGLGLSERCDAIAVIVSEERGTISIARDGALRILGRPEDLIAELRDVFERAPAHRPWWRDRVGLDAALAAAGALVLWGVLIPGSEVDETTVAARIELTNLPEDLELEAIEPPTVEVTLRGLRRDLLLAEPDRVTVRIDSYLTRLGRRTFSVSRQQVRKPDSLSVVSVEPETIKLSLAKRPATAALPEPDA